MIDETMMWCLQTVVWAYVVLPHQSKRIPYLLIPAILESSCNPMWSTKKRFFDHILVPHRKAGEFQSEAGRGLCFCGVWLAFPWFSFHGGSLRGFWETWNLQHHPLVDSSPWRRTKIIDISINSFSLRPHSKRFFFCHPGFHVPNVCGFWPSKHFPNQPINDTLSRHEIQALVGKERRRKSRRSSISASDLFGLGKPNRKAMGNNFGKEITRSFGFGINFLDIHTCKFVGRDGLHQPWIRNSAPLGTQGWGF